MSITNILACLGLAVVMSGVVGATAAETRPARAATLDPGRTLPFSFSVTKRDWNGLSKLDFPVPFFQADGDVAMIHAWSGPFRLYRGPSFDRLAKVSEHNAFANAGSGNTKNLCVSGAWYDAASKTLYAVIHCERLRPSAAQVKGGGLGLAPQKKTRWPPATTWARPGGGWETS